MISPHAGYVYSGPVAAWGFAELIESSKPETVVIIGPNHRGFGYPVAIISRGDWETPLGKISIDSELAEKLTRSCSFIEEDEVAHQREHSIEIQIPFLQYGFNDTFKIVPICLADQTFATCMSLGQAISDVAKDIPNILLIASTDFTHYQTQRIAEKADRKILDAIISANPLELKNILSAGEFSMCGYGPVITVLHATSQLGCKQVKLLKYATSGDITGDYSAVVGYASLSIEK